MFNKTVYLSIIFFADILTSVKASDLPYKEGELLIRFSPKVDGIQRTTDERNQILASFDAGTVKTSFKLVPSLSVVKLPVNLTVVDALPKLRGKSGVLYVEPNYKIKLLSTFPNDTYFTQLWGMHNTGQDGGTEGADIDAPGAWEIITNSDVIVAVIDTGVDYTHPDLSANMWVNQEELNGDPNIDDDGNGYIDDVYGYDFSGYTPDDQDADPIDEIYHGTHCAGTVGAVGNNGEGVAGVCWNVKIMALRIFPPDYLSEWEAIVSNALEAIDYAVNNSAKVINASWSIGNNYSQSLKDTINNAGANGVLFIAAAGNDYGNNNDQYQLYPCSYDCNNIISVMATNNYDNKSGFSNYGPNSVDIGAPGSYILSTFPTYMTDRMAFWDFSTYYETISGTSMAAPHVAGACALVWGMNPALSYLEVKDILVQTVDKTLTGLCVSEGRLNLYNAIVEAGIQAGKQAVILNKVDDVNGPVLPGDHITYTISFENTVRGPNDANFPFGDLTNITIVDHLPAEVDCNNPFDPNYNSNDHTYTWNIGTLTEDDWDSVELTVVVNNLAEPLGKITNVCVIEANEIWPKTAIGVTDVNCWNPGIIYVDMDAFAVDSTGMSWEHPYTDLQYALERARNCCANEIWVAEGTYKPTKSSDRSISFELLDDVAIYGGFAGTESHLNQRDLTDPNNETILSGDIGTPIDQNDNSYHVVKCEDINNAVLDGFTITAGHASSYYLYDPNRGGGIYCKDSNSITVRNCVISQNEVHSGIGYGGGIYFEDSSNLTLTDCKISDNTAYCGGALYNESSETNVNNCIFSGNSAMAGGGMYNHYEPSTTITNCTFTFNGNTVHWFYSSYGGGICNVQSSPTLINCTFSGNSATTTLEYSYGGAICNWDYSDPNVTNCTFSNNSAYEGGAVHNYYSDPNIINCVFTGNSADAYGGGICSSSSYPNITNCTFSNNSSPEGGAVYNYDHSDPNIINCVFNGNTADYYGGGMVNSYESSPTIINCTFSGNSATTVGDSYGGAMCNWNDSGPNVTNCTFSNNSAYEGGGVYNNGSDPNITNCILWDNVATVEDEIYNDENSHPNISYSDIKGGWTGTGTGNINIDPCFFDVEQSGSWTENASYDNSTFQSTLTDAYANWSVNQLAGKFVSPNTPQLLQFFIVSNDVNTIKVWHTKFMIIT
jgi:uncharacterized repeat protein (TIGR01451 family)